VSEANDSKRANQQTAAGAGIGIGVAFGALFGLLLDNLAVGIGVGLACGAAAGFGLNKVRKDSREIVDNEPETKS